jgi:hypothetical protein
LPPRHPGGAPRQARPRRRLRLRVPRRQVTVAVFPAAFVDGGGAGSRAWSPVTGSRRVLNLGSVWSDD